jgi:putative hydrolase of the HAD superfamily
MIRGVIFDIGGVVIRTPQEEYYSYLSEVSGKNLNKVQGLIKSRLPSFETGKINLDKFSTEMSKALGINKSQFRWIEFYKERVKVNKPVIRIASGIHKKYTTAYLTNVDRNRHAFTVKLFPKNIFDYKFTSFSIGYSKPDPKIYEYVIKKISLAPSELLLIDNELQNIRSARKIGMHAVQFKNVKLLKDKLSGLDIALDKR